MATVLLAGLSGLVLSGCQHQQAGTSREVVAASGTVPAVEEPALRDVFEGKFLIGTALHGGLLAAPDDDPKLALVTRHFNVVTAANAMKWGPINPEPGRYVFEPADRFMAFAEQHDLRTVGHVLFWHSQTPDWVFHDESGRLLSREALLERMRERVKLYAERYGAGVEFWDVVNESINDDGSPRDTFFHRILGDDWEAEAFRMAAELLPPHAKLIYNDYNMTQVGRRDAVVAMVRDFQRRGIRIDGIGMQGHWSMRSPTVRAIEEALIAYGSTGVAVHVTEFDIDLLGRDQFFGAEGANVDIARREVSPENNPYVNGLPPEQEERFADRYAEVFGVFLKHHDKIARVTFWGVTDADSWLNHFPVRGRTNFALLFDRQGRPKPAFHRVVERARATP